MGILYAQTGDPLALVMAEGLLQADKAEAEKKPGSSKVYT